MSAYSIVTSKLRDAETKENDLVIKEIRREKDRYEKDVMDLEQELIEIEAKLMNLHTESNSNKKLASELARKVDVDENDRLKDAHATRLIDELNIFTHSLKKQKKKSLEDKILQALKKLMHKADFISRVEVVVEEELIDIELFDKSNNPINKEVLSKGEQQLYATALLKALVDESNIRFPLFVDSPLQKFDKKHAQNIVKEFYPTISEQVVLFPLLEKELSNEEYRWLLQRVNKVYVISHNTSYKSTLQEVKPEMLFEPNLIN